MGFFGENSREEHDCTVENGNCSDLQADNNGQTAEINLVQSSTCNTRSGLPMMEEQTHRIKSVCNKLDKTFRQR